MTSRKRPRRSSSEMQHSPSTIKTIFSDIEKLSEKDRARLEKERRNEKRKALLRWINDGLVVAAIDDKEIARAICRLAGWLARKDAIRPFDRERVELRRIIREEMKRGRIWDEATLRVMFIDYAHYLLDYGNERDARTALAKKWKKWLGYDLVDGRWQMLLSQAANLLPVDAWPEDVQPIVRKRLDVGQKRRHRGVQVTTNESRR